MAEAIAQGTPGSPELSSGRTGGGLRSPGSAESVRIPPQDIEAEMSLLGSMMLNREAIELVLPIIGREESGRFYQHAHREIFELLIDLYDRNQPIDLIVVRDEMQRRGLLEKTGGVEYMVQLSESVPSWLNAEYYARIVRDKAMLRDLIACTGQIRDEAFDGQYEAKDILDHAEREIFAVTEQRISRQFSHIRDIIDDVFKQIQIRGEDYISGAPSGFFQLDEKTTGFQKGEMIVLAARPSMGKTALALNMAEHMAVDKRIAVAFFSMEMSNQQIVQRILCSRGQLDSNAMRKGRLTDDEVQQAGMICGELQDCPFYVDDTPGMTALELRAKARRLKARYKIEVVFVDYLQLMYTPNAESRQQEVSEISRAIKGLARELNLPVIVLSQLNRGPEGRDGHEPRMSDLRESGAIEQDADVVLLLHREGYYKRDDPNIQNIAELIIAKQRNGPTDKIKLNFNQQFTKFGNLSFAEDVPAYASYREASPF
jgi:replicative DNA helicase